MKVKATFTATFTQTIDWPDDERDSFDYDNLMSNLDTSNASELHIEDLDFVLVDGKPHEF